MTQHSFFKDKQILVIDQDSKIKNDRTWCFWEKEQGTFENIVHHKWKQLDFFSNEFFSRLDISPYEYKMIRGIDFYNHVLNEARNHNNIHFYNGKVDAITNENDKAIMTVNGKTFSAGFVFNSILFKPRFENANYLLLQHFKGWIIKASANVFDHCVATFMDFRISQNYGNTFVYVLPLSANSALIEYTLISKKLLEPNQYDEGLKKYITEFLKLKDYAIEEEEFGVIPMTNYSFSKDEERIINMGTAGGQTKGSSGFTFRFIQKHCDAIIQSLIADRHPYLSLSGKKKFRLYDSILLNILSKNKMPANKIFSCLFKKNSPQLVLKFLDSETNLKEDLKIMSSVPSKIFLPAAIQEIFKR